MTAQTGIVERRLFWLTFSLSAVGSILTYAVFGWRQGLSFVAGSALAGADLMWLRHSINAIFSASLKSSEIKIVTVYLLRLLFIPLCLYVMIRFLSAGILAAVAGFSVFVCSVWIEGILEAFNARKQERTNKVP
jgi:hypothetical protein